MSNVLIVFIASIFCMFSGAIINVFDKEKGNSGIIIEFLGALVFIITTIMLLIKG